jgi:hypothetical protein
MGMFTVVNLIDVGIRNLKGSGLCEFLSVLAVLLMSSIYIVLYTSEIIKVLATKFGDLHRRISNSSHLRSTGNYF